MEIIYGDPPTNDKMPPNTYRKTVTRKKTEMTDKNMKNLIREISIPQKIDFPSIIKLNNVYLKFRTESKDSIVTVLDMPRGMNYNKFKQVQFNANKENTIHQIIYVIYRTLNFLKSQEIYHRDIKPDNIVFIKNDYMEYFPNIIDFGCSREIAQDQTSTTHSGTQNYYYGKFETWHDLKAFFITAHNIYTDFEINDKIAAIFNVDSEQIDEQTIPDITSAYEEAIKEYVDNIDSDFYKIKNYLDECEENYTNQFRKVLFQPIDPRITRCLTGERKAFLEIIFNEKHFIKETYQWLYLFFKFGTCTEKNEFLENFFKIYYTYYDKNELKDKLSEELDKIKTESANGNLDAIFAMGSLASDKKIQLRIFGMLLSHIKSDIQAYTKYADVIIYAKAVMKQIQQKELDLDKLLNTEFSEESITNVLRKIDDID